VCWVAITFHIVVFSRVLFRAPDLSSAIDYLRHMFSFSSSTTPFSTHALLVLVVAAALHWFAPKAGSRSLAGFMRLPVYGQAATLLCIGYLVMALSIGSAPFVYFQF
jgi:hypothetical protein